MHFMRLIVLLTCNLEAIQTRMIGLQKKLKNLVQTQQEIVSMHTKGLGNLSRLLSGMDGKVEEKF